MEEDTKEIEKEIVESKEDIKKEKIEVIKTEENVQEDKTEIKEDIKEKDVKELEKVVETTKTEENETEPEEIIEEAEQNTKKTKKNTKKRIYLIIIIALLATLLIGFIIEKKYNILSQVSLSIYPSKITSVEIEMKSAKIELGETTKIDVHIQPENYSKNDLVWHISNPQIVEISDDGNIIGKAIGKAVIYLSNDTVKSNEIEVECTKSIKEVQIENLVEQINLDDEYTLEITVLPEDATNKELKFESSNDEILSIDAEGKITAKSIGKCNITIKNYAGEILKTFSMEVIKVPVEKIKLDDTNVTLGKGQSYIINAIVSPENATYPEVVWTSSNENVVTINDRIIKAVGVGSATITAITDNGEKKETCNIKVNGSNPNNTKKYANGNYNIRTGPSTDYKVLATTTKYEEIEILKDVGNSWKKVRNSKGVVGYTLAYSNYYLSEKPKEFPSNTETSHYIKNVPYLNQFNLGYPTGCEAVSATMVLKYKGYSVSVQNIVNNTKTGSKKYQAEDGTWYGANPFEEFVGHPTLGLSKGSWGVFAKPIAEAMSKFAGGRVKNISGCSEADLFSYVDKDIPVVVWCVKNAGNLTNGVVWQYEDGSGSFQELVGQHCAVLIGYDENYVWLNDPSAGQNVRQRKSKFISNWKTLYSQAIVIE